MSWFDTLVSSFTGAVIVIGVVWIYYNHKKEIKQLEINNETKVSMDNKSPK
jgi:hypothetical protein